MPVVRLLEESEAPLPAQEFYAGGDPGPIVAALAHVPELLEVTLPFLGTVLGPSAIALRTKEVVILRASVLLACRYCVETHTVVARDAELSVGEVRALRDELPVADAFPEPADRALIAWVDAVAVGPGTPPAELAEALSVHFDEAEVAELTLLVGATLMLNRFSTSLRLPTSAATLQRLGDEGWS